VPNRRMIEILWHRRETRRQTENTNFCLNGGKAPAYSPVTSYTISLLAYASEAMPQTDESMAPCCWACALPQVGQAPRTEGRRTARSCISGLWPLALGARPSRWKARRRQKT
jgi:hypothetical protein